MGSPGYGAVQVHESDAGRKSIDVYNYGKMKRDFTYIDDIVEAVVRVQDVIPQANADWTVGSGSRPPVPRRIGYMALVTAHQWN
ncbi:NAD-dependent epimerase/dehydratase family protein [Klebsiella pneumoniae subsp. pneumoniae]|nr:NAD-dependent epimerase/dehydratase family protein [Klebsiella pneumoniae subsp. pneumoniae]